MSENMDVTYTRGDNIFTKFEVPTTFRSGLVGPNRTDEQTDRQHIYCVTARLEVKVKCAVLLLECRQGAHLPS